MQSADCTARHTWQMSQQGLGASGGEELLFVDNTLCDVPEAKHASQKQFELQRLLCSDVLNETLPFHCLCEGMIGFSFACDTQCHLIEHETDKLTGRGHFQVNT